MTSRRPTQIALSLTLAITLIAESALPVGGGQCECDSESPSQLCCCRHGSDDQSEARTCCCQRQASRRPCCKARSACCQAGRNKSAASHGDAQGCQCQCRSQRQVPPTPQPVNSSSEVIKQLLSHDNCSTDDVALPASFARSRSSESASVPLGSPCSVQVLLCRWLT